VITTPTLDVPDLTLDDCVRQFQALEGEVTANRWQQAAICASLERRFGARTDVTGDPTPVQVFCEQVGISRQKFWRYQKTHDAFYDEHGQPRNPVLRSLTEDPNLPFKVFQVAAAHAKDDPVVAVLEAQRQGWSANRLQDNLIAGPWEGWSQYGTPGEAVGTGATPPFINKALRRPMLLFVTQQQFEQFVAAVADLKRQLGTTNTSDTVVAVVFAAHDDLLRRRSGLC
jgi:hypothetical protein